jgi:hypothetical protein
MWLYNSNSEQTFANDFIELGHWESFGPATGVLSVEQMNRFAFHFPAANKLPARCFHLLHGITMYGTLG